MRLAEGDKVVCTGNRGIEYAFPTGQTFEILEATNRFGHDYVVVMNALGRKNLVRAHRFERKENT